MREDGSFDDPSGTDGADVGAGHTADADAVSEAAHDLVPVPRPPIGPEALRRLPMAEHQDPDLDDDLAAWHHAGPPATPVMAILGEPTVRAPGPVPTARPSWFAEARLLWRARRWAGRGLGPSRTDGRPRGGRDCHT